VAAWCKAMCLLCSRRNPNSGGVRRLCSLMMFALAGCVAGNDPFPTLARRPVEGPPPASSVPRRCAAAVIPTCAPAPAASTPLPPAVASAVPVDDIPARLAVLDRDLGDAGSRLDRQATVTQAAARAAGTTTEGPLWSTAQIEMSALDRIGSQIGDLHDRLDAVAGTLAEASAGGTSVAGLLDQTGRMLARAAALQAKYTAKRAALP